MSLLNGTIPVEKFVISKVLAKDPSLYPDIKSQPHVCVALRMRSHGLGVGAGDTVPYIVCTINGGNKSLSDRAFYPEEVKKRSLKIDVNWYIMQQLISPIARYCELIPGMTSSSVAISLGVDPRKYSMGKDDSIVAQSRKSASKLFIQMTDEEKFKECTDLHFKCSKCGLDCNLTGMLKDFKCPGCHEILHASHILYPMMSEIRSIARRHYQGFRTCSVCKVETRQVCVYADRCPTTGKNGDFCKGQLTEHYSSRDLYLQLLFYRHLVKTLSANVLKMGKMYDGKGESELESEKAGWDLIGNMVQEWIDRSSYPRLSLGSIFAFCTSA